MDGLVLVAQGIIVVDGKPHDDRGLALAIQRRRDDAFHRLEMPLAIIVAMGHPLLFEQEVPARMQKVHLAGCEHFACARAA